MSRFDVVGFGALNVDKLFKVEKIAGPEEESSIIDCVQACGGSAANTIVGLARLGLRTGFIGKVSKDKEGGMLIGDFRKEGVDTKGVVQERHGRSGAVLGFVDNTGQRALYVDPGVNDAMEFEEIDKEYACETRFLHLTSFVGEKSFRTQERLLRALPRGVEVSLDPGALYARMGLAKLGSIIKKVFVCMPNASELKLLTGKSGYQKGAEFLLGKGVSILAVKLGSKGCYVTDGGESHLIEAFSVEVVDTTGAGDAFGAGFLYGLVKGKTLYDCGRLGNFVAAKCIAKMGARPGLPRLEDLKLLG